MNLSVDAGRSGILWLLLVYVAGCQWVWHMMFRYAGVAYDGELSKFNHHMVNLGS